MSAIKSTSERTHIGTMHPDKARLLAQAKARAVGLANEARQAEEYYRAMLTMAMPAGANEFDQETMSFFYNPARDPQAQEPEDAEGEASGPAGDTDDS